MQILVFGQFDPRFFFIFKSKHKKSDIFPLDYCPLLLAPRTLNRWENITFYNNKFLTKNKHLHLVDTCFWPVSQYDNKSYFMGHLIVVSGVILRRFRGHMTAISVVISAWFRELFYHRFRGRLTTVSGVV